MKLKTFIAAQAGIFRFVNIYYHKANFYKARCLALMHDNYEQGLSIEFMEERIKRQRNSLDDLNVKLARVTQLNKDLQAARAKDPQ